jgi:Zn-dependent protease with chaperone function
MASPEVDAIRGQFFDGRTAAAREAQVWLAGDRLHIAVDGGETRELAARAATWTERQRHGQRQLLLPDGAVLSFADGLAFDAWAAAAGRSDSWVVRAQQSWRHVGVALVLLVAVLLASWRWGLPAAAEVTAGWVPESVGRQISEQALVYLDKEMLKPSQLSAAQQQDLSDRLHAAVAAAEPRLGAMPAWRLHFREGGKAVGPNAFALPSGDIVVTDEIVKLLEDQPNALVGVLGHELGHVRQRHTLRQVFQAGAIAVIGGVVLGDFSALLASAPALLASSAYSRDFEREADQQAYDLLLASGQEPAVMAVFFERVAKLPDRPSLPIAISSHPAEAERIAFFSKH